MDAAPLPGEGVTVLREFLNVYWLRPENALWRALDVRALTGTEIVPPSLDLSCGDGIFSFIWAGGRFDPGFDIFGSEAVANLASFHDAVDIFDSYSDAYRPGISERPDRGFTVGSDWKSNLLAKAGALDGFYDELVLHDNRDPLPFPGESFQTVFSNSVYWVPEPRELIGEIRRVLRPSGTAILVLRTDRMREYTLSEHEPFLGSEWLDLIDHGRSHHHPGLKDADSWIEDCEASGLVVEEVRSTVGRVHAHMWDVGLRPLSPYLIEMSRALATDRLTEVKSGWIDTLTTLLDPFLDTHWLPTDVREAAEITIIARRG